MQSNVSGSYILMYLSIEASGISFSLGSLRMKILLVLVFECLIDDSDINTVYKSFIIIK